jgi:hypothetical protein
MEASGENDGGAILLCADNLSTTGRRQYQRESVGAAVEKSSERQAPRFRRGPTLGLVVGEQVRAFTIKTLKVAVSGYHVTVNK